MVKDIEKEYGYYFGPSTLYIEFNKSIVYKDVEEAYKEILLSFPNSEIEVVAYKNILGYWAAMDIKDMKTIYCGTQSSKTTKTQILNYLNSKKGLQ